MLNGTLKTFSLGSLLQICSNENDSGALEFSMNDTQYGRISFENGNAVYADFLGMRGVDAVRQLYLLKEIDFKYNQLARVSEKNINQDINFLILDCARYADEATAYIDELQDMLRTKYPVETVRFFEYDNSFFAALSLQGIVYYESMDHDMLNSIYLDENIKARVQIIFTQQILTDYLLIYMRDKGMLK